jgi:hypothetical protein
MDISQLYLERYGMETQERLALLIREAKTDDPLAPVTIVVPSQYAGLSLRRSLGKKGGLVNVRFMVTARLAEYLGSPTLASQGKVPRSSLMELAVIQKLAGDISGQGPLGGVSKHPKLLASIRNTFRNLSNLSAVSLQALETKDSLRKQIVDWYRLFGNSLDHYYTREELSKVAAIAVKEGRAGSVLKDLGFTIFCLVSDFSPGEIDLINALGELEQCAVILGLTGESETDMKVRSIVPRLEKILSLVESSEKIEQRYGIQHLLIAPDAQEEIRWVVRTILKQAEEGLPFHRVAVLYRQSDPYGLLIHNQMRFAGIPVSGPDSIQLKDTPIGKLLLYLLEILESDFARDSVMRWIAETPVKTSLTDSFSLSEYARWEVISREIGITKGISQWQERLDNYIGSLDQRIDEIGNKDEASPGQVQGVKKLKESASSLRIFIQELSSNKTPPEGSEWGDFAAWSRGLIEKYTQQPDEWPEEHQGSYDRIVNLLDELKTLDDLLPGGANLTDFISMLNTSLETSVGRTGPTGSGVFVASVASAQGMDFEVVYIVGMAEGVFPPRIADDALLPDRIRATLPENENLPLRDAKRIEERRLFLAALASGQQRILSYPRTDTSSQRGQFPSPWFVSEAGVLYGDYVRSTEIEKLEHEQWLSVIYSAQHSLSHSSNLTPADTHDYDLASIVRWHKNGHHLESHFLMGKGSPGRRSLQMEKGRQGSGFTVWDGCLVDLSGTSRRLGLPQDSQFSPTKLQRWAECPFKYYLGDILRISTLEQPEEIMTISAMDKGSLIHEILERFVATVQEQGDLPDFGQPWTDSHVTLLTKIADEEFEKAEADGLTGRPIFWGLAKEEIRHDLVAFLDSDGKWRGNEQTKPLWVERRFGFGNDEDLPPVIITRKNGSHIRLRGIIDRVDESASGTNLIVIDYKSGTSSPYRDMREDPLGKGRFLQLPVYAQAIRNAHDRDVEVEALYWFATTRGGFERKGVPLAEVEDRYQEMVEIIASGIEQGIFPANPGPQDSLDNCRYCDFKRVCPANVDILWERKKKDSGIAHYLSLSDLMPEEEVEG